MTLHGLVAFYISWQTHFVHKSLYCSTCVISSGIYVGRVPGFIVHWNQKCQPTYVRWLHCSNKSDIIRMYMLNFESSSVFVFDESLLRFNEMCFAEFFSSVRVTKVSIKGKCKIFCVKERFTVNSWHYLTNPFSCNNWRKGTNGS